ncbi:S1 family peptidase [Actinokineospora pegani]|uniref:S1 family peptidase n=1 Tax=Actinokineospora pegani TaxID=2654637 RepID=UPI0012EA6D67|nr:serine protease [Actinokineospora pegani]
MRTSPVGALRRAPSIAVLAAVVVATAAALTGPFSAKAGEQVIGGARVSIADHQYMVFLASTDGRQFCGGTLVGADKVVTAAHCAVAKPPEDVRVVASREDKLTADGVVAQIERVWVHPEFTSVTAGNDVAVLTLDRPLSNPPIELATDPSAYAAGAPATVLGWGRTAEGGSGSRYLLGAEVPVVADTECSTAYADYAATSMVCAGLPEGGVDTCQGDSGGPMIVAGRLAGVASWGEGCAQPGRPGVYARIATLADLIRAQM